ncbi:MULTISPECIES: potassium/proton antiporter [Microvirgula]|uniref:potassium/proton antiporter n=1 Tax=Microvirgula TaxID=57479 RepID=UPI00048F2EA8|nr:MULTISPECIES: potassium/proton antiporter [Microvirgula]RAS11680.1 potassium/proton antiporter (CPA1 family) [Microvirgula sp. AG722]
MEAINTLLLLGGGLLFLSVLASLVSARFGVPLLLVFLVVGMLAGEDGPGGIRFDNYGASFFIGNLALAIILLNGGLQTSIKSFRTGLKPALSLATVGVLVSAGLVGVFAMLLMGIDLAHGLLLGAIIGSTDAAAVFALLRSGGIRLNDRVGSTLEIESGANDPMAVLLVLMLVGWMSGRADGGPLTLLLTFVTQFGVGALAGLGGGWLLSRLFARLRLADGLYALLLAAGGISLFALANKMGGSGFLAIYLAGVVIGNRPTPASPIMLPVMDGLAWFAQAVMFLMLGLLVTPSKMVGDLPQAFAVAVFLMLVARPVAVMLCLRPFRFPRHEVLFVSWVGLRGAVPIVIAIFPMMAGVPASAPLFGVTFAVVLVSLLVQGSSLGWMARKLGVVVPEPDPLPQARAPLLALTPTADWLTLSVHPDAAAIGEPVGTVLAGALPGAAAHCLALSRHGQLIVPDASTRFAAGDDVLVLAPAGEGEALSRVFLPQPEQDGPLCERRFFGDFVLDGSARLGDVAGLYGETPPADEADLTLDALFARRYACVRVVGDRIRIGRLCLTIRAMNDRHVGRVGLRLAADRQLHPLA